MSKWCSVPQTPIRGSASDLHHSTFIIRYSTFIPDFSPPRRQGRKEIPHIQPKCFTAEDAETAKGNQFSPNPRQMRLSRIFGTPSRISAPQIEKYQGLLCVLCVLCGPTATFEFKGTAGDKRWRSQEHPGSAAGPGRLNPDGPLRSLRALR